MTFREVMDMAFGGQRQYSVAELDRTVEEVKNVMCDMVESKSSRAAIGEALTNTLQPLRQMSELARHISHFPRPKLVGAVTFARQTWLNDGAEGETVHLLCDAVNLILDVFGSNDKK